MAPIQKFSLIFILMETMNDS